MSTLIFEIIAFLRQCGVTATSTLLVHSGIKELSQQNMRANDLCEALINLVNSGTLLMPTMTWRIVTAQNPYFSVLETPSHTGVLTEIFRKDYATKRSLHPTHSVAGFGVNASTLLEHHHKSTTPCSSSSPYGILLANVEQLDSYILHIKVGLESSTMLHFFEETYAPQNYLVATAQQYTLTTESGDTVMYQLYHHNKKVRDFHRFGPLLYQKDGLFFKEIGGVTVSLVKVSILKSVLEQAFMHSKNATLAGYSYVNA
ncbi:AAC(3) family N-acetyltransferase [Pseudoalteromonas xiamenensis]|uniref:Aminoglycoside N(3)-acetyltransferase n=1 Tax=Pseudoalteromonas xiamenensis TaxID=882626 RepID=A0A975DG12_9GAMM|nr:AAC(3) family N-acetyltransferase [Pseudoalteromonas xiamenensis]QTH71042.1 AAC(3) family N-acetyltransferase [Pseudoalteromonas xiamenensis]